MGFTVKPLQYRPKKHRRRISIRKIFGSLLVVGIFIFLGGAISLALLSAWVSRDLPNPNALLQRNVPLTTKIYDRTGERVLYEIHGSQSRTLVKLEDLPAYVKWAMIDIEDKNFYNHKGFVFHSIVRAFLANIFKGGRVQGASTITQQFVKNAILTNEKTVARKIKELILSTEIENKFTKDEILQLYFNEIPYGRSNYGIEAASQSYFGKSAHDLTLTEGAALAAITQAPTTYLNNPDKLLSRRNLTLDLMVEQGHLDKDAAEVAKKQPLEILARAENNIFAPHFSLWIKEQLTELYGERTVEQGGLKVISTLDYDKQKIAEEAVKNGIKKIEEKGGANAALVAIDPKTGQILSMVGSRDFYASPLPEGCKPGISCQFDPHVNVSLRERQPGSSFKPIVYTAGFIKGYTPTNILYDVITTFKNEPKDYTPHNYDGKERGPVTVRQALAGSLNIPAVKMIYLTGIERVLDLAENLGYTTLNDRSRFGLSLVLGGGEVKLLEHVAAYGALANDGARYDTVSILKVEDNKGNVLQEWKPSQGQEVIDPAVARQTTDILQDNNARAYIFGASNRLTLPNRPVAAKTGTTNDFHDAWTLGYTPSLVAGVWVGNNNNKEMSRGADGSVVAAPIWQEFMQKALAEAPIENFPPPEVTVTGKPVLDGQIVTGTSVTIDRASGLLATALTPSNWVEQKTYGLPHSILFYVNKDDPRGGVPTDPGTDPQFANWEEAIRVWANNQANSSALALPPTAYDNLHVYENQPTLIINQPTPNATVFGHLLNTSIQVSAPRGISRVVYVVDGVLVGELKGMPFDGNISLPETFPPGNHTLTVTAYDDIDNSRSVDVPFVLQ